MNFPGTLPPFAFAIALSLCATISGDADTVQLTSGQEVTATVTRYHNNNFEVRTGDNRTATYSANSVRQIQFENRETPVKLTTRNYGVQEGSVTSFENGTFNMRTSGGSRSFPAIFVEQAEFVPNRGQVTEVISHGQQVDIRQHLAAGNVTIIDYYADWCGPCRQLSPLIERFAQSDPEIALRKIDIVDWKSPVAKQYHITAIPHVEIYGRSGRLIGTVGGADPEQIQRYIAEAKTR